MPQALETILQMTLDLEALNKYFHVDSLPERKPLRILKTPHIPESVRLEKFGASAVWTSAEDSKDKPVFEFSSVKVEESLASVAFRYPPEGIAGTIEFQKQEQQWVVTGSTIVEN